jgi:hypothetical protein
MPPVQNALPTPNAVLRGPFGSLVIVASGVDAGGLWRFQVFAPHGGAPTSSQSQANQIVQELARDAAGLMAVRQLYGNRWGGLVGLSAPMMVARLRRDLADGIMFAAFYIPYWDFTAFAVTNTVDISGLLTDPPGTPLSWSPAQRIAAMLRRIPGCMAPALRAAVEGMLTPKAVALFAELAVGLAISQAFGAGEIVDSILVAAAWRFARWQGLMALKDFITAIIDAAGETTLVPIQADAQVAADALATLGLLFLAAVLHRAGDQEKVISTEPKPPKETPPAKKPPAVVKGWKDYAASQGLDSSKVVFRGDGRPPTTIFAEGFQPKGTATDLLDYAAKNSPSNFVGTSKFESTGKQFAKEAAQDEGAGYMYVVAPNADGIDVNQTLGAASPYPHENEIAFPGGLPSSEILGAQQIGTDGSTIGPFISNPGFSPP